MVLQYTSLSTKDRISFFSWIEANKNFCLNHIRYALSRVNKEQLQIAKAETKIKKAPD